MGKALIEHAKNDINGDNSCEEKPQLRAIALFRLTRLAAKLRPDVARQI